MVSMDITPYTENLRRELVVAAEAGGDDARALAERLTAPLESAIRLTLLDALSPPRTRSRGSSRQARSSCVCAQASPSSSSRRRLPTGRRATCRRPRVLRPTRTRAATARINLRLPEHLKAGIEQAAGRERMSVNTWLVRTAAAALAKDGSGRQSGARVGQAYTGWVR